MKKFKGIVNGKEFTDEKEFSNAVKEAVANDKSNLYISSYYSDSDANVCEKKEDEQKPADEKKENILNPCDYAIGDRKPQIGFYGNYKYTLSESLKHRIIESDNKDAIIENSKKNIDALNDEFTGLKNDANELRSKIEKLSNDLFNIDEAKKDVEARIKYYESIIETAQNKDAEDGITDSCRLIREVFDKFIKIMGE